MYVIEKNVPIPPKETGKMKKRNSRGEYPIKEMSVGDSFFVPMDPGEHHYMTFGRVRSVADFQIRRNASMVGYTMRFEYDEQDTIIGVRIWRIK